MSRLVLSSLSLDNNNRHDVMNKRGQVIACICTIKQVGGGIGENVYIPLRLRCLIQGLRKSVSEKENHQDCRRIHHPVRTEPNITFSLQLQCNTRGGNILFIYLFFLKNRMYNFLTPAIHKSRAVGYDLIISKQRVKCSSKRTQYTTINYI